jgi:hypothetical protein
MEENLNQTLRNLHHRYLPCRHHAVTCGITVRGRSRRGWLPSLLAPGLQNAHASPVLELAELCAITEPQMTLPGGRIYCWLG